MRVETVSVSIIDTETGAVEKTSCSSRVQFVEECPNESTAMVHKFTTTELFGGTLSLGKKAPWMVPGEEAVVFIDGKDCGVGKVHSSVLGRIDGLTRLFRGFLCPKGVKVGDAVLVEIARKPALGNSAVLKINISTAPLKNGGNYEW